MSLTEAETVFASIHENGLNDFLTAFCTDRPRYLNYGSPAFVPATTAFATSMAAIPFPGIPGGIEWRIRLTIPRIDLFQQSSPLPPELTLSPGQFSLRVGVELCLDCRRIKIDPRPPRGDQRPTGKEQPRDPGHDREKPHPPRELTCCRLEVFAVGHLEHVMASNGQDAIAFAVDAVELVDITPDPVESLLECLLFMILQAMLAAIRLPLPALRAGAFHLAITVGPFIEDDQVKARGNV